MKMRTEQEIRKKLEQAKNALDTEYQNNGHVFTANIQALQREMITLWWVLAE